MIKYLTVPLLFVVLGAMASCPQSTLATRQLELCRGADTLVASLAVKLNDGSLSIEQGDEINEFYLPLIEEYCIRKEGEENPPIVSSEFELSRLSRAITRAHVMNGS